MEKFLTMGKYKITVIIAVIAAAAAFYGGMLYGESSGSGISASPPLGQQFQGGGFRGSRPGGNSGVISGDVTAKDGQSITVKTRDGSSHIVFYSSSTNVVRPSPASINDIAEGGSVLIAGTVNSDGSLTAQSIQVREAQQSPKQ